jgi:sec-independent protein translocase protein TatA
MVPLGLIGPIGFQELLLILLIIVVLFGARRIPEIARGLGEGIRGFRSSLKGETDDSRRDDASSDTHRGPKGS